MIRFVLAKNHPFHDEKDVRVVGDGEALGKWNTSWGRVLFRAPMADSYLTSSLLVPVGAQTITFNFVVVRKHREVWGPEIKIEVPEGIWRLTDAGSGRTYSRWLQREEPRCSPTYWPGVDTWAVFDGSSPSLPAFALRGPCSGRPETLLVYFHPMHGRLDKPHSSVFNDPYAPPAYGYWRCLENTVVLIPACPPAIEDGEEVGSGHWMLENYARSEQKGQDLCDLIDRVRKHYAIDYNRVVGFGTSNGGYAILEMMSQFPNLFAKTAAISAHIYTPAREVAAKIPKDVPLYFFHCTNDAVCPISDITTLVSHLRTEDKNVDIWTGVDNMSRTGHSAASYYAVNRGLIDWLLDPTGIDANTGSIDKNDDATPKDFVCKHERISLVDLGNLHRTSQLVSDDVASRWSVTQGWVTLLQHNREPSSANRGPAWYNDDAGATAGWNTSDKDRKNDWHWEDRNEDVPETSTNKAPSSQWWAQSTTDSFSRWNIASQWLERGMSNSDKDDGRPSSDRENEWGQSGHAVPRSDWWTRNTSDTHTNCDNANAGSQWWAEGMSRVTNKKDDWTAHGNDAAHEWGKSSNKIPRSQRWGPKASDTARRNDWASHDRDAEWATSSHTWSLSDWQTRKASDAGSSRHNEWARSHWWTRGSSGTEHENEWTSRDHQDERTLGTNSRHAPRSAWRRKSSDASTHQHGGWGYNQWQTREISQRGARDSACGSRKKHWAPKQLSSVL